ncbi:MAG: phospho-N-acetylmuramoyl-pentapeptide-transferase, partial [Bacteroidales bacterium]|nr:phospho-N-acetylmuramoyl-pentapeptide-transferase [Bacteroidales bacterium]
MIYHLFEYLKSAGYDFPGMGLMGYITFRAVCCSIVAILTAFIMSKKVISFMQRKQIGEEIRDLGLEGQLAKKGTPTMGGVIILASILVPALLFGNLTNINTILLIITTIWLGFLGFLDDYIKVFKHNKEGLRGIYKIIGQVGLGLIIGLTLYLSPQLGFREKKVNTNHETVVATTGSEIGASNTKTTIPFVKNNEFDYKWLSPFSGNFGEFFKWCIYILIIIFIITGCSNGANLTDGMDGLTSGVSAIVGSTLGILAYVSGHAIYADYLNIMYIPYSGEILVFMSAFVGALLGFLWYNSFP